MTWDLQVCHTWKLEAKHALVSSLPTVPRTVPGTQWPQRTLMTLTESHQGLCLFCRSEPSHPGSRSAKLVPQLEAIPPCQLPRSLKAPKTQTRQMAPSANCLRECPLRWLGLGELEEGAVLMLAPRLRGLGAAVPDHLCRIQLQSWHPPEAATSVHPPPRVPHFGGRHRPPGILATGDRGNSDYDRTPRGENSPVSFSIPTGAGSLRLDLS